MPKWTKKRTNKSYNRKPYIKGEVGDYTEMIETIPRQAMLNQRLEKKSQFDKPYLNDDYPNMEYKQPPQLPSITNPDLDFNPTPNPVPSNSELPPPNQSGRGCALTCYPPTYCNGPVECHFSILSGINEDIAHSLLRAYKNGATIGVKLENDVRPIKIYPDTVYSGTEPCWPMPPDNELDTVKIEAWLKDSEGVPKLICETSVPVSCSECPECDCDCESPPDGTFEYDTENSAETVTPGSSADIYVLGGCPPFQWSCDGESEYGFHFGSSETEERVNTLSCYNGLCGGSTQRGTTEITVIDNCGESVTGLIKNPSASWESAFIHSSQTCPVELRQYSDEFYIDGELLRVEHCCTGDPSYMGNGVILEADRGWYVNPTYYTTGYIGPFTLYYDDYWDCSGEEDSAWFAVQFWRVPYCRIREPGGPLLDSFDDTIF